MNSDLSRERIVVEGDVPKVERTRKFFTELRASLKNGLDVTNDLENILCPFESIIREQAEEIERLRAKADAAEGLAEALQEADRILEWWHGTYVPHTKRQWDYDKCEPCSQIREKVRGALARFRAQETK